MSASSRSQIIKALTAVNVSEQHLLDDATAVITEHDPEKMEKFSREKLSDIELYKPSTIYKLCAMKGSREFLAFCKEEKMPHTRAWSTYLQTYFYAGRAFHSIEKGITCSVLDQYVGSFLYKMYKDLTKESHRDLEVEALFLKLACSTRLFQALSERCKVNANTLISGEATPEVLAAANAQLEEDANLLGNLYWSVGYLEAALILLDVGNYYANNGMDAAALQKHKMAVEFFLRAREIHKHSPLPENDKTVFTICQKRSLEEVHGSNWKAAENFFFKHIDQTMLDRIEIESAIVKEMKEKLSNKATSSTLSNSI